VLPGDVSAFSASKARYYAMYSEVIKPSHAGRTKELFKVKEHATTRVATHGVATAGV
jgi:hypothetical protein